MLVDDEPAAARTAKTKDKRDRLSLLESSQAAEDSPRRLNCCSKAGKEAPRSANPLQLHCVRCPRAQSVALRASKVCN